VSKPLPQRSRSHVLEKLSRQHVEDIFPVEWVVRSVEQDYGLDLSVEIVSGESVTGCEFSIQLKATDSLKTSGDYVLHRCKVSTANYFLRRPEPVMYLVYDASEEKAYWLWIQPYLRELDQARPEWREKKTVGLRIPKANSLTPETVPAITDHVQASWERLISMAGAAFPPRQAPLPADLADFTGRQAQIDRVRDQLNQQGTVTITGMGGIGKTALAVHVAHQLIDEGRFRDAQLYVDLQGTRATPVDPVDALDSLINAILKPDPNRPRDLRRLAAIWRKAIDGKDAILILDNAADAAQVRPLLPGCPTCAVLVTSRVRFTLPGARRLDLRPMQPAEARCLLQELAPHLDDDGADQIADLCGRLPQALRVAGNYLGLNDDITPEAYAAMLADERTRLAQLRDPDDPDLDVYANISLSVDQLDQNTRRAWALLSLFPAPFDLPAAAALWDAPEDQARTQLQALRNRSLVTYDRDSARYHQHDLVRLAAAGDLEALTEQESHDAHLRLARHYEQVALTAGVWYWSAARDLEYSVRVARHINLEWPHIRAGQAWAAAHAEHDDEAAQLCSDYPDSARYFLDLHLHPREFISWFEAAARAARRLGDREAEGKHLGYQGNSYSRLMDMETAVDYYQQALEIAREIDDKQGMTVWLDNLGMCYADLGEMRKAIDYYHQALELTLHSPRVEARVLAHLGNTYHRLGETGEASYCRRRYLEIVKESGAPKPWSDQGAPSGDWPDQGDLSRVYAGLGELEKAIEHYTTALEIAQEIGDRYAEVHWHDSLGSAHEHLGEMHTAIEHYTAALEISREIAQKIGDRRSEAAQHVHLGQAYRNLGDTARARDHWTRALAIFEAIQDPSAELVRGLLAGLEE